MLRKLFFLFVFFLFSIFGFCLGYSGDSTVLCADGLGSVKTSQLCNYEANCNDASDELNFNLCKTLSKYSNCEQKSQVRCDPRNSFGQRDQYWSNKCTDIITACNVGPKCFTAASQNICNEVQNGRLKTTKFTEPSKIEKTKEDEEFHEMMKFIGESMNETMKRNFSECPPFFTPFREEDKCVSLFTPIQVSWFEARMFCESMTGSLAILDDIDIYIQLLKYIQEKEIKSRFWVGAKFGISKNINSTGSNKIWTWLNGEPVTMGAPFWSLFTSGTPEANKQCQDNDRKLMPQYIGEVETCLSLLHENFYYFSDEWCTTKLSPLCMTNKI